ncbi:hypothetical protein HU200_005932 [Digitaria exilis]|uniref:Uncharacterized protein n=1 Tax=Digitaria exilis TaxID=1010633 RepID=A0A835KS92_9POAL|nr:hypothetical protein HU200_005932 [Digitaria exilis]
MVDQVLIVDPCVLRRRPLAAGRRPPALRHEHLHARYPLPRHRRVEGIHGSIKEVLVHILPVLHHGVRSSEQSVAHVHVAGVVRVGEVRVDIHHERRAIPRDELEDGAHELVRLFGELAIGGQVARVHDGLRHLRGHLDLLVQPGVGDGGLDVLDRREEEVDRRVAGDLVSDGDVAEHD